MSASSVGRSSISCRAIWAKSGSSRATWPNVPLSRCCRFPSLGSGRSKSSTTACPGARVTRRKRHVAFRDYARDVLRLSYAVSAILPHNTRSRRVAEESQARKLPGEWIQVARFDRYVWPLAVGGETRLQPISSKR